MEALRTTLKWGFRLALLLLVVLVTTWAVSRALYPTQEQREAVAEMERQPDYAGENAFALLWTLDRDVPDGKLETVMAEDVRRFSDESSMPTRDDDETGEVEEVESARETYPDLGPSGEDGQLFCTSRNEDCLARVREDPEAYDALVERNRKLLDRVEKLHDFDHVRIELPYRMDRPLPSYQPASFLRTRHAVEFIQGQTREAVAGMCRNVATWRRLGAHSDNLITRMVGVSYATDQYGYSLANMLAELPVDMPLPDICDEALSPPTLKDVSMCDAMRSEFGMAAHGMRDLPESIETDGHLDRLAMTLLFDAEATVGMSAEGFRGFCARPEHERLLADRREIPESPQQSMWRFACVANFIGCTLNSIGWPGYADYSHRLQDYAAKLRVLGTLAWMRRHAGDGRSPSELLADRPEELQSPARDFAFGPEGRTLRVSLYDTKREEHWSIPLPPALYRERTRPRG